MSPTLAIDFGSSRTKIAYLCPDEGKPKIIELGQEIRAIMPSVFYIPQSGPVLVGDEAAQMADEDPAGIVTDIKRELHRPGKIRCGEGRPTYQRWELVSILFSEIRRRCDKEVFHNGLIDSCMLTVPVCFSEPQRQKLRQAAERAGFTSVRLLEEPTAAAMHWLSSSGKNVSDHVIVVDIGGGTTDLAALKLCGSTYESIPDLPSSGFAAGGNDIDEEVRRLIGTDFQCNDGESGALLLKLRQVKERLPKMNRDVFTISLAGRTRTIQRHVVELAVRTLVEKTCAEASRFLKDFEEVTGRANAPVLLAGGGSRLTGMQEALADLAGADRVFIWNDGEYAIALGATLAGAQTRTSATHPVPGIKTAVEPIGAGAALSKGPSDLLAQLEVILTKMYSTEKQSMLVTAEMVHACEMEANHGNSRAQALLADCYEEGFHLAKNPDQALSWYQQSVNQNDALGQAFLGGFYLGGKGVSIDEVEAVKWLQLSANQGCAVGQVMLGMCLLAGKGVPIDEAEGVKLYRMSADQGDPTGQYLLGVCYLNGEGVAQSYEDAVKWFLLSADQGRADAQNILGLCYLNAYGCPQNLAEAVKWFRLSADQGNAEGQTYLGCRYLNGEGVPQNYAEAVRWFRFAADQGDADAQYHLGNGYLTGKGVPQNHEEALKWYRLSADQGDADAQNQVGLCYFNGYGCPKNLAEAVKWFRLSADQGNAEGQCNLGFRYLNGEGIPQNYSEAVKWFRLAADQGRTDAQNRLGLCYFDGDGIPRSRVEAVKWFRLSADQGDAWGQYYLGHCYFNGKGVSQNHAEAAKWYRLSADQKNADAQNHLGLCYYNGKGVPQSPAEAVKWFLISANQGQADAQYQVGLCYRDGKGVPQSPAEAVKWFRLSADQGNNDAKIKMDLYGAKQSWDQMKQSLADAKQEMKKWWSK